MPCVYKPNYQPYDFLNQSPSYQWGIGRAAGYVHFDKNEFSPLQGESTIQWMINMSDKVSGSKNPNPHSFRVSNKNHMLHRNILRGSKYLAYPIIPFNGTVYDQSSTADGSAIMQSETVDQGIMFYWDDFTGKYNRMKAGDTLTISVDVRTNGDFNIYDGAVALKATPNFSDQYKVTTQEISKEFTRVIFQTRVINTNWNAPEGWDDIWGAVNPEVPKRLGRTWNKDRLIGIVQNVPDVQIQYARPMVSLNGATEYEEAPLDVISPNLFNWKNAKQYNLLQDNGKYAKSNYKEDFADPTFYEIPKGATKLIVYKMTKTPFEVSKTGGGTDVNAYGKIVFYTGASEDKYQGVQLLSGEDGKYGGELAIFNVPEVGTHWRYHVTSASSQAADIRIGFYLEESMEFTQEFYSGITNQFDGKLASAYAENYGEQVRIDFEFDMISELKKAFPKMFDGLSAEESAIRVRDKLYTFSMTATLRGGAGNNHNVQWWQIPKASGGAPDGLVTTFKSSGLTSYTHKSTFQTWVGDDGYIRGYFLTEKPTSGERAYIDLDYFNMSYTVVATNEEIEAWKFNSGDSRYLKTPVADLTMRTELDMEGSSVQITHGYDIYGIVNRKYPEFFGDCYTYEDCISKLNERIKSFTFEVTSSIPDPDVGGTGIVNYVLEASERVRDFKTTYPKNTSHIITVNNNRANFVHENGFVYLGFERPPEDRETELSGSSNITFQILMDREYDQNKRIFRYNKQKQPWYLFVRDIQRSVLPPKVNNLVDMNKGRNRYSYGQTEEARSIILKCFIKAPSEKELAPLMEDLANYLDVGETTLQLYDAPERVYQVVLDGTTDLSQTLHMGEIELNLILLDNYAKGNEVVVKNTFDDDTTIPYISLENEGTAPTYPRYILDFKKQAGYVDLIGTQESSNISIGRRNKKGAATDSKKELRPRVFYSKFTNDDGAGWISLNDDLMPQYIETQKPTLSGSIQRSNGMINLNGWKYGDNKVAGLHGHGVIGTLKKNVNNFVCEITPAIYGNNPKKSLNAIYVIFYDDVNKPICHAKIGTRPEDGNVDMFLIEEGNNTNWGRFHQSNGNKWDDFKGKFVIERKNNQWRLTAGQYKDRKFDPAPESNFNMGTSMLKDTKSTGWVTLPTETWNRPVARVGLYLATWKDRPLAKHLSARRCIVWEDLTDDSSQPSEEAIVFNEGDQVVIDSEKGQTYLNGVLTPKLLDPMTDWFPVEKGENIIGVNNFQGDLTVVYNERFK